MQKFVMEEMRRVYAAMEKRFMAYGETSFEALRNPNNPEDKNVTVVQQIITETDEDGRPFYDLSIVLIEPDGSIIDMKKMMHPDDVNQYLQELVEI